MRGKGEYLRRITILGNPGILNFCSYSQNMHKKDALIVKKEGICYDKKTDITKKERG